MIIGFLTIFILICWKTMFRTKLLLSFPHVLILTPLSVDMKSTLLTITFSTPCSSSDLPRLPILFWRIHKQVKILSNLYGKKRIFLLPDAMAWTALNALYRNMSGSWTDGDAIVPGSNS